MAQVFGWISPGLYSGPGLYTMAISPDTSKITKVYSQAIYTFLKVNFVLHILELVAFPPQVSCLFVFYAAAPSYFNTTLQK